MKLLKRNFIKFIGFSLFLSIFYPLNSLLASAKRMINPNLTNQQKKIMFNEDTERPFSSELLNEKEKVFIIVLIVELNSLLRLLNLIVELGGHLFQNQYLVLLKQKLIIPSESKESSIIVVNVAPTTDTFLMMVLQNHVRDFVTMDFVSYLNQNKIIYLNKIIIFMVF